MANIIEQQDLLKGLPDARLATLMQNPDGSMPPFLVAAEAQRRQSIRQQYSGAGNNESVVDTLTKQMSKTPENLKAPAQTPPQMPPPMQQPMQQAGIGALPQDQGMADGGEVRRFAGGALVTPQASPWDQGIISKVYDYVSPGIDTLVNNMQKFGVNRTPEQQAQLDAQSGFVPPSDQPTSTPAAPPSNESYSPTGEPNTAPPDKKPPSATTGTDDTSPENKYKSMEADMRHRLEGLYADDKPSNWENAQKWFAMSQQIMNPDATLMQGLVNAGAAYADSAGNQAAQQRQGSRARDEALLNWDMQIMQGNRSAEAAAAAKAQDRQDAIDKRQTPEASDALKAIHDIITGIDKKLEDPMGMMDPKEKESLLRQRQMYEMNLASIMDRGGFGPSGGVVGRNEYDALGLGGR